MVKALILILLLGCEDFRIREQAHTLLKAGMLYWSDLVEACETWPDAEIASRCWAMTEQHLLTRAREGTLLPIGAARPPLIEKMPLWLDYALLNRAWQYRERARAERRPNASRRAVSWLVQDMLYRGYAPRYIREVLAEMWRNEHSRLVRRCPPVELDYYFRFP